MTRLFAPQWAGGWALTRILFGLAMLDAQALRYATVRDGLVAGVSFASGPARLVDRPILGDVTAWVVWALGLVFAAGIVYGGRWTRLWVVLFFLDHALLLVGLGLNVRAPERVMIWATAAMLFGPIGERGLTEKWRSPAPRWFMLVFFSSLYGATGFMKLAYEPDWRSGQVLAYDLVDRWHAGGVTATWLSGQPALVTLLQWGTIVVELAAPILLWFRLTSPIGILLGLSLHLTIGWLMDVGPLGTSVMALYPALLHPYWSEKAWRAIQSRR